ncbi:MAG: GAF domain-containing protein [Bacteroidota bacterium]
MSENIIISDRNNKKQMYEELIPQLKHLLLPTDDLIANLANCSAALKEVFNFWWVGFYIVKNNQLSLGPFQGPIACTSIQLGKGVCGTAWQNKATIIVPNVHEFPGHIACSGASNSEIVIPIIKANEVLAVLDVDSEFLAHFDETDKKHLEEVCTFLAKLF